MKYLTAIEAARRIGVNEKTIRLWVKSGALQAHHPAKNRLAIPESEIERIAREREQYQPEQESDARTLPDTPALLARIDELERRLTDVEKRLAETPVASLKLSGGSDYITQPQKRRSAVSDANRALPTGAMSVSQFAALHGVNRSTFWDHVRTGIHKDEPVQVSTREKPNKPGEIDYYVAPEDRETVYSYWRRHGVPFTVPGESEQATPVIDAPATHGEPLMPADSADIAPVPLSDMVSLNDYADLHGVSRNVAEQKRKAGFIHAQKVQAPGERHETIMLAARGRRDFWVQFHDEPGFRTCDECPHTR